MNESMPRRSRSDTLFLIFVLLGLLTCLGIALGVGAWSLYLQSSARTSQALLSARTAIVFAMMFLLGLPGLYWAWRGRYRTPSPASKPKRQWAIALILIPLAICLGSAFTNQLPSAPLLGLLAFSMASCTVILAIVLMVRWIGPRLSPRRAWGHFLVGLWGMPAIAMVLEIILFVPSLILLGVGLALSPEGQVLLDMLTTSVATDTQILYESLSALTTKPWVIGLAFFNVALLVPLLEEIIKTMTIWPLLRRKPTPAQGFLGGALAGAGFALFEALSVAEPGQAWLGIVIVRSGTTLMHVFTAAITNWALVRSMRDRKWGTFALALAGAVGLHGIWNASALGVGLAGFVIETDPAGPSAGFAVLAACAGILVLIALSGLALIGLPWLGRKLSQMDSSAT